MKLAYYISDYGFGHATRSIAIIRELLKREERIHITICTSFSLDFIRESLADEDQSRLTLRFVHNDFGFILKDNSIEPDISRFREVYCSYIEQAPCYIEQEVKFMKQGRINVVIGDVPPFPFIATSSLNIPSIGISNFTWYTAYLDLLNIQELSPLHEAYRNIDYFIELGAGNEPKWGKQRNTSIGFFSREMDNEKIRTIREKINLEGNNTIIYFGLGMKIDVDTLNNFNIWDSPNCVFIVANNVNIERENVYKIPIDDTESQNYIAASDIVISKPGWGTVSEAIQANKPLLIINRSYMREDKNTINYLLEKNRCDLVSWDGFDKLQITDEIITKLTDQDLKMDENFNGLDYVVGQILEILRET